MGFPINIEKLIAGNIIESDRMEFKKGWNPQSIIHSICAFANDYHNLGGGYIFIGIEEKNGKAILPPIGIDEDEIDNIQKELLNLCHQIVPNYFPIVEPYKIGDKYILVIWAFAGDTPPYKTFKTFADKKNKVYYIRKMSSTVQANENEVRRIIEQTPRVPFDNRINQQYSLDDLDLTQIIIFLRKVGSDLYKDAATMPFEELCLKMGIARGPEEYIKPINVGLLMFNEYPHKIFRGAKIEVIDYHDDIGDKFTEHIFTGPIQTQLKDALSYIKNMHIKEEIRKIDNQPEAHRFYNYPYEAIEEALANAVYHKSYDKENTIELNLRNDCVEIISYEGPLPPVNNDMLKKKRIVSKNYRNSRIGDFMKELDLTEGRGTGIPKIKFFMNRNGSPEPIFETDIDGSYFLTTLIGYY